MSGLPRQLLQIAKLRAAISFPKGVNMINIADDPGSLFRETGRVCFLK